LNENTGFEVFLIAISRNFVLVDFKGVWLERSLLTLPVPYFLSCVVVFIVQSISVGTSNENVVKILTCIGNLAFNWIHLSLPPMVPDLTAVKIEQVGGFGHIVYLNLQAKQNLL